MFSCMLPLITWTSLWLFKLSLHVNLIEKKLIEYGLLSTRGEKSRSICTSIASIRGERLKQKEILVNVLTLPIDYYDLIDP